MAQHRAALPGGSTLDLDSPAELATALLERLGALTNPGSSASRHRSGTAVRLPTQRAVNGRRVGQVAAALSVTAVGAAAVVTATGAFAAVSAAPSTALSAAPAALALLPAATTTGDTPHGAVAVPGAELPAVQVSDVVDHALAAATGASGAKAAAPAVTDKPQPARASGQNKPGGDVKQAVATGIGSGVGSVALTAARTALGKPYKWGATGPSAFDCSGLVKWAFAKAGVTLPRTSAAQSTVGKAVARSQIQPGDLVFFYTPVSHVGIYIGNGKVINATQDGEPVQISNIDYMPVHNIRRL